MLLLSLLFLHLLNSQLVAGQTNLEDLARLESYQNCNYDRDCKENSFCFGNDDNRVGRCKCEEHYLMNRNRTYYECLETIETEGSPCIRNLQCQYTMGTFSLCANGVCVCPDGTHLAPDNRCYNTIMLTEICRYNYDCRLADGTYGFCYVGRCSCNLNQHPSEDRTRCVESSNLGQTCSSDDNCNTEFAACYGVCRCIGGFIESSDNSECLKAADTFGDNCTESVQCSAYLPDTYCNNGICGCRTGYHGYGNRCYRDVNLGGACIDRRECILAPHLEHSVNCTEGVCTCTSGSSTEDSYGCVVVRSGSSSRHYVGAIWTVIITIVFIAF